MRISTEGCAAIYVKMRLEFSQNLCKEAAPDVRVRVRRVVPIDVEQTVVGVLVIVATRVQARVGRIEIPVVFF